MVAGATICLVRTNADRRRVEERIGSTGLEGTSGVGTYLPTKRDHPVYPRAPLERVVASK